ncbi:hypothetical protein GOC83_08230 [Haloarcula rubripromontorii]|uniref:Uncharacterized protein n=1 Tax=Haloarcula rubripromontorii TaxID=1705562 RepID=A0A847U519_9EURY|nr:hypothetical protein [Haloarcula rubripromontorii]NLV06114.1 hypothetical protein [Haloarcula rubripromontorii]
MTDSDERLLTAAKLNEVVDGNLDGGESLHEHTGLVADDADRATLSFVSSLFDTGAEVDGSQTFGQTALSDVLQSKYRTEAATRAIEDGNGSLASFLVGITEQELDASSLTVTARLMDRLDADGTLTTVLAAGRPNTGKTNTMFLLASDMARAVWDDVMVISNSKTWEGADRYVSSMHDLMTLLVENRDVPKTFVLDEASRYMDARVYSREVSTQYAPALKAMSKLGVEVVGAVGHTGKDVVPECKRLTNLAFWKSAPGAVEFYTNWDGDADRPDSPLFDADLTDLEPTLHSYDPDDVASWKWNLNPDVWRGFDDWNHFGDRLKELGPTT